MSPAVVALYVVGKACVGIAQLPERLNHEAYRVPRYHKCAMLYHKFPMAIRVDLAVSSEEPQELAVRRVPTVGEGWSREPCSCET